MGYLQQMHIKEKENNMDTNTINESTSLAEHRLEIINKFREIINNLPWEEINTGDFHPQRDCSEVRNIREAFMALGCDEDRLLEGVSRRYCGVVRTNITLYYYFDAESDELAEEHVQNLLQDEHIHAYSAEEMEVDLYYDAEIEVDTVD